MQLHQSRVKILKKKVPMQRMKKVMTRSMKLMRPLLKKPNKSRVEMRRLIQNSTKRKRKTHQLPLKSTHLPRLSPLLRRNPKLLTKRLFKRPPTPPFKKLNLLKSRNKNLDLRKSEKERDAPDSSHQFSAHSKSNKN